MATKLVAMNARVHLVRVPPVQLGHFRFPHVDLKMQTEEHCFKTIASKFDENIKLRQIDIEKGC